MSKFRQPTDGKRAQEEIDAGNSGSGLRDQLTTYNVKGGLIGLSDLILIEILSNVVYLDDFNAFLRVSPVVSMLRSHERFPSVISTNLTEGSKKQKSDGEGIMMYDRVIAIAQDAVKRRDVKKMEELISHGMPVDLEDIDGNTTIS